MKLNQLSVFSLSKTGYRPTARLYSACCKVLNHAQLPMELCLILRIATRIAPSVKEDDVEHYF